MKGHFNEIVITIIASLHEGGAAVVSGAGVVFTRATPLSVPLSLPLKWVPTFANSAAQCCCEPMLYALFFQAGWPIRAANLFTSVRFPVFRSRANLVEWQFRICVVVGCRLPDGAEIAHVGSALCHWIRGSWRPLDGHFEWFLSSNRPVAARVNST